MEITAAKAKWCDGVNAANATYQTMAIDNSIAYINTGVTACSDMENKIQALEKQLKPKDVPEETKTELLSQDKKLVVKYYKDGYYKSSKTLMPDIKDVKVYPNVVFVYFTDDTFTKAVLDKDDIYGFEQGISICLTKKLLGEHGSSLYNKLIQRALKVMENNEKEAEKAKQKHEEIQHKLAKAKEKQAKRKAKKHEEAVSIYAEAFAKALGKLVDVK